jgi:alpha-beta hydrolase superfamily lysophospholipase
MRMPTDFTLDGHSGALAARRWDPDADPRYVVLLVHGYGEHIGRYEHVAARLNQDGALVYGLDHVGHGRSEGERVLVTDFESVVEDLRLLHKRAAKEHSGLPAVLIGHSLGGAIAARYAQRFGKKLACVVLSAPVIGEWAALDAMLGADQIPDTPVDPQTLSRDPSVGRAYAEDPLVWHGPFKRATLEALRELIDTISAGPPLDRTPVLWLHGAEDQLVPYDGTVVGWSHLADAGSEASTYPGARHEIFNETNKYEVLSDVLAFVGRHVPPARKPKR